MFSSNFFRLGLCINSGDMFAAFDRGYLLKIKADEVETLEKEHIKLLATRTFLKKCLFVGDLVAMMVSDDLTDWFVFAL